MNPTVDTSEVREIYWQLVKLATNAAICGDADWAAHLEDTATKIQRKYNI